jgi:uncharacterized membrane protein
MIDPLEYMCGGDTAVAAIQYSYLPSWISFVADKAQAQDAGRDPLVTSWQVAADLALSTAVPPGHGRSYGTLQAATAWASIAAPPGWTAQRSAELGTLPAN